ncbi:MAG TPA: response regulator [Verrucomicrobiae bacterium]|nr:response regulator [Verrucomicrobiae bacterium]
MKPILQVEDDSNDVFLLQHALTKAGVANPIQVATDGQQAINYLQGTGKFADREKFPLPCLVLLDLKLPYVMGLEVLKWIRQHHGATLVVILLTASAEDADIAAAYRLGANAFLTKPSMANKLDDMAKAIKDFWLTHNTLPKESHAKASSSRPVHTRTTTIALKPLPPANGASRERRHEYIPAKE